MSVELLDALLADPSVNLSSVSPAEPLPASAKPAATPSTASKHAELLNSCVAAILQLTQSSPTKGYHFQAQLHQVLENTLLAPLMAQQMDNLAHCHSEMRRADQHMATLERELQVHRSHQLKGGGAGGGAGGGGRGDKKKRGEEKRRKKKKKEGEEKRS